MVIRRRAQRRAAVAWQVDRLSPLLYALGRELRAGATIHGAVATIARDRAVAGDDFVALATRVAAGAPVVDELDRWAAALDHPDAEVVRAVLALGVTTGAALAATLDRAAARLADRAELQREIRALGAPARASALVLTLAPVAFLALLASVDSRIGHVIVHEPLAAGSVAVGVVLNALGWWWMWRLTAGVEA